MLRMQLSKLSEQDLAQAAFERAAPSESAARAVAKKRLVVIGVHSRFELRGREHVALTSARFYFAAIWCAVTARTRSLCALSPRLPPRPESEQPIVRRRTLVTRGGARLYSRGGTRSRRQWTDISHWCCANPAAATGRCSPTSRAAAPKARASTRRSPTPAPRSRPMPCAW